jgi:hypothetical protein
MSTRRYARLGTPLIQKIHCHSVGRCVGAASS